MRFIHLADLHLGRSLGDFDLAEDQRYMLEEILNIIREKDVDTVLIAGDVYDKAIPSEAATNLLDEFLCSLSEAGVNTFIISGNHDSDDRLHYGSRLFESGKIYIAAKYEGTLYKKTLTDRYGEIDVYLLPFVKASQVRHYLPEADIGSYEDAVRAILEKAEIDPARRSVIAAHQFVTGDAKDAGTDPVFGGSEGPGTKSVGLVEKIGSTCFDGFDYAALGHIHSPQAVGRREVRYAGSPLKYSLSEAENIKTVPVVTVEEKGHTEIELVPLHPLRDLRHIRGTLAELLDRQNVRAPEDYIYATLTDEDMVNDSMAIMQQTYPRTVHIDFDNSRTRKSEQVDISDVTGNRSFAELIGDFYKLIYDVEIPEEEMEYMRMVAKEAGVLHEAD